MLNKAEIQVIEKAVKRLRSCGGKEATPVNIANITAEIFYSIGLLEALIDGANSEIEK